MSRPSGEWWLRTLPQNMTEEDYSRETRRTMEGVWNYRGINNSSRPARWIDGRKKRDSGVLLPGHRVEE